MCVRGRVRGMCYRAQQRAQRVQENVFAQETAIRDAKYASWPVVRRPFIHSVLPQAYCTWRRGARRSFTFPHGDAALPPRAWRRRHRPKSNRLLVLRHQHVRTRSTKLELCWSHAGAMLLLMLGLGFVPIVEVIVYGLLYGVRCSTIQLF